MTIWVYFVPKFSLMRSQTSTSFWKPAVLAAMSVMALLPSSVQAQFTGFSAVMDTIWHADGADDIDGLEFYGSYSIYAEFTSATDVLSSLYSDVAALGTPAAGIEGTCGCFQSGIAASPWLWEINPALIPSFPDLQYSTGWTIGMYDSGAPGAVTPLTQDFAGPCEGFTTTNGAMFVVPEIDFETGLVNGPAVAVAGDDLKVLVARVTTCGEFTLQSCVQTFPGGDQSVESYVCAEPFTVIHPYQDGECLNDADGDGVCDEFEVLGCTDPAACNFDPEATQDDMSCEYAIAPYDCDGECVNDADGDGICDEFEVEGCTGKGACNFDPNASDDDGTCFYPGDPCDDGMELTEDDEIQDDCGCLGVSCHDPEACNFSTEGIEDNSVCSYIGQYTLTGETDPFSQTLQVYTYTDTEGSSYEWNVIGGDILEGNGTSEISVVWNVGGPGSVCVVETSEGGCEGDEVCLIVDVNVSSIEEALEGSLEIFPVPARDNLHLVWTGPTLDNAYVVLRDAAGRAVKEIQVNQRDVLDISALSAGSYMLEFTVPERGAIKRRIVVQ